MAILYITGILYRVDDLHGVLIGKDINEGRDLLIDFFEEVE